MERPGCRQGKKRPAAAAESQPVLEEPAAPSAGPGSGSHPAEAAAAVPEFDHYGCSKCKKKGHGCTRCKTFANDNRNGYFWLGSQVVRKIPGADLD